MYAGTLQDRHEVFGGKLYVTGTANLPIMAPGTGRSRFLVEVTNKSTQ